jgi:DNA end-binding protein Ku
MPARSIDTATIAFGLVSIPVKIYSTSEPSHEIHFHLIHEGCGERLKQQYICPKHGEVSRAEISKGYELTKGNFVELSKEELANLEAVSSDELAMKEFVPATAIDPIYVERTYYLGPGKGGERAYRLFRDALEYAKLVGVASYSARGKEYVVMVRPFEDGLAMHQLRYRDEIKPWDEVPIGTLPKPQPAELKLAQQIVSQLASDEFHADRYEDEVKGRVRALIAKKAKGGEIVAPPEVEKPAVTDLMAALKASLSGQPGEKPVTGHASAGRHRARSAAGAHRAPAAAAHRRHKGSRHRASPT